MDKADLKEKLIILGITSGIFLPVRVLFATYVSENWIGSFGLVLAFGIAMVVLVKQKKLGRLGIIFEKQMIKTIGGNAGKYIIVVSLIFSFYFGMSLYYMDKGNVIYFHDKEIFYEALINKNGFSIETIAKEQLLGPENLAFLNLEFFRNLDYALSISFSIMNDVTNGWLGHFVIVIFVEQLEVLGLLFLYRHTYKSKPLPDKSIASSI